MKSGAQEYKRRDGDSLDLGSTATYNQKIFGSHGRFSWPKQTSEYLAAT